MKYLKITSLALAALMITACGKEESVEEPLIEEELVITAVRAVFTPPEDIAEPVEFWYSEKDEDDVNTEKGTLSLPALKATTTYDVAIYFLNEDNTQMDSINYRIMDEGDRYQVFLQFSPELGISQSYIDADLHSNPVGLGMQVVTDTPGSTNMKITLLKEPDKEGIGVKEGDITNAEGQIAFEAGFVVSVQ